MRVSSFWVPPLGDLPALLTVGQMQRLARQGSYDPRTRFLVGRLLRGYAPRDGMAHIQALREWMADHVTFMRDPSGAELVHGVPLLLDMIDNEGEARVDCDDAAILAAALGKSVGLQARFVLVGFVSPNAPYSHVWTELRSPTGGPWVDMDVTRSAQRLPARESRVWTVGV